MPERYTLRLRGVRFRANLGVSRSERCLPQEVVVDVDLLLPTDALPSRDRRQDVVDYDRVAGVVVEEGRAKRYRLIETYAQRLVERLLDETPAMRVAVAITKSRVPTAHSVDGAVVELVANRAVP
jgi:dihydroneopterin aldolase